MPLTPSYADTYARWRDDPVAFWREAATAIDWIRAPEITFDPLMGTYGRWFPDGLCNTCHNLLDRHVAAGRGGQTAIVYDSPVTGTQFSLSYAALLEEVRTCAVMLAAYGVETGDRVILYMPMVPEAIIGMLACARIGAVHSVVFGGFAAPELASRIDDAQPRMILSATCGLEAKRVVPYKTLLDEALTLASHKPAACIVLARPQCTAAMTAGRDHDWAAARDAARHALAAGQRADCVTLKATDPLYILYTSGTTGRPKGVVRDNGGHMVALRWSMAAVYGVAPGDVYWAASDIGWAVGHSYIVYAPLLTGCTTVLYEGKPVGTPDAGALWRVIADHGVSVLFTAPTGVRAVRKEDPEARLLAARDIGSLRALFLAGERADPDTVRWAESVLKVPVIDHWWQTETGWAIAANPLGLGGLPVKHGSPTVPMPGYAVEVLDTAGLAVPDGTMGTLAIRLPLPPGALPTLWNADDRFHESYLAAFPGYYTTADAGYRDDDGYLFIMGRTDDIINVAGHRLSTGALEEVVACHAAVAECAVVGIADPVKGEVPWGLVVLKNGSNRSAAEVAQEVSSQVRSTIGALASLARVVVVDRLPKTRSGKILRGTVKSIIEGRSYAIPATIEDPAVLDEIARSTAAIREAGPRL